MENVEIKIIHFGLIVLALVIFSKLSFDAIILGAVALILYSKLISND
jgi:hypothetical protein